jgi:uracil DNA glycosylase
MAIAVRVLLYVFVTVVLSVAVAEHAAASWAAACEADIEATECDLEGLVYMFWGGATALSCAVLAGTCELVGFLLRRRSR